MTKISKRFLLYLISVVILMLFTLIFINTKFIKRYYTYIKKQEIIKISDSLINNTSNENIKNIENNEKVIIVKVSNKTDINIINEEIRKSFLEKGLGLEKYWLWEEDYNTTIKDNSKIKIYRQEKLNYSLLVRYLSIENDFITIAMIIPNISEIVKIINIISIFIFIGIILFISIIILYLLRKVTNPIFKICDNTKNIAIQKFEKLNIKTNDEIEILSNNINFMSDEIQKYQESIINKNKDIENLLNALTHDLKTPISLIKLYSQGIKDNLDDGTFLDIIVEQNNKLNNIISQLLDLFKIKQVDNIKEKINLSNILNSIINEQVINLKEYNVFLNISENITITGNKFEIELLLKNLITNAIKYSYDKNIDIYLYENIFYVINGLNKNTNLQNLFKEFYVGEKSRNKEMSGTGLGLSIVKAICEKNNYEYGYKVKQDKIKFFINF